MYDNHINPHINSDIEVAECKVASVIGCLPAGDAFMRPGCWFGQLCTVLSTQ
jgi:hypothetical protein